MICKCMLPKKNKFILFLFDYIQNNQMNFEDTEIDNRSTPSGKSKRLGVIVLTDNRINKSNDKNNTNDFRCSAYKETQVDPLQFTTGLPNFTHDEDLVAQLTRRIVLLQERVQILSKIDIEGRLAGEAERKGIKKKNRRKFKELVRDSACGYCQKVYGSDTALKFHIKLKHNPERNHSQAQ